MAAMSTSPLPTPQRSADPIGTARRVLDIEAEALRDMSANLPEDLERAVSEILRTGGRVILSGIGKSGLIARKIASTFASTGTPSAFVHAAEASHGDLGMVSPGDLVILISNSGETSELRDIVAHAKRFAIPIIGISGKANSTLIKASDFTLLLPPLQEACINGLAPTTSTTVTLALGDALAVAVMEQRGFLPENYRTIHPGGKLGARLATVAQLMHPTDEIALVAPETSMPETLVLMSEKGFGSVGVLRDGTLGGVISDGDLRRNMSKLATATAGEVATSTPLTTRADDLAAKALAVMSEHKVTALFVTDAEARPVGLIHLHDCLRAGLT